LDALQKGDSNVDQLINQVADRTGLSPDRAREAVEMVVSFLKSKLPAPIASQIDGVLGSQSMSQSMSGAANQAQQALGGLGNPVGTKSA